MFINHGVLFDAGLVAKGDSEVVVPDGGCIVFMTGQIERFRIGPDGAVWVNGDKVATDPGMYKAFQRWLTEATAHSGPNGYQIGRLEK